MEILLVEDEPVARKNIAQELQIRGVRVLTASDDTAGLKLFHERASSISAVITDMRLRSQRQNDHSGALMAMKLKAMKPDLPVYCNSAIDVSDEFPFFEHYFLKGAQLEETIYEHIDGIVERASSFEQSRFARTPDALLALKRKYAISDQDFFALVGSRRMPEMEKTALLLFHHAAEEARDLGLDVAVAAEDAGIPSDILVVDPADDLASGAGLERPVPVVLHQSDHMWIAELFGFPLIYTYADTREEAIAYLLTYLRDSYRSLFNGGKDAQDWPQDMIHFGAFLKSLFSGER